MAPVVAFNKLMVSAPFEIPSSGRPRRSANNVDLPAPLGAAQSDPIAAIDLERDVVKERPAGKRF
jgi:hypothetical protein